MTDVRAAIAATAVAAALGWLTPRLVRTLPEPEPVADDEPSDAVRDEGPKEPYVDLAALGWLAPVAAAVSGVAGGLVGWAIGWSWLLVGLVPLVPVVVALSIVDLRTRLLPARVVVPTTVVMVGLALAHAGLTGGWDDLRRGLLAMALSWAFLAVLWFVHPAGLGYGDVRLGALLGLVLGHLGWPQLVVGLYSGFLLLAVPGALVALLRRDRSFLKAQLPFGPFLAAGALVGVVAGEWLLSGLVAV